VKGSKADCCLHAETGNWGTKHGQSASLMRNEQNQG